MLPHREGLFIASASWVSGLGTPAPIQTPIIFTWPYSKAVVRCSHKIVVAGRQPDTTKKLAALGVSRFHTAPCVPPR